MAQTKNTDLAYPLAITSTATSSLSYITAIRQYFRLIILLLAEYRISWFYQVFFGTVLPLGLIFFFKMNEGQFTTARAVFLLGGNMASSIAYGPATLLISRLGWARQNREFHYWAALPISKLTMVLAMISVYLLFSIPGVIVSYVVGSLMFGLPLFHGILLIILVPLSALSLTGLGAFLGTYARNGEMGNALGNGLLAFVTFLSPTIIPLSSLPGPLRLIAMIMPTTYAADAFRAVLMGNLQMGFVYDVFILVVFTLLFLLLVHYKLDWRGA